MEFILVWVLMSVNNGNDAAVTYSPVVADIESCQRMQNSSVGVRTSATHCIQIKVLKVKQ